MITRPSLLRFFLAILCMGVLALTCSFLAAHVFALNPCTFCKIQRIPFFLLIIYGLIGLTTSHKEESFKGIMVILGVGALLGGLHFLMQLGLVPDFCPSQRDFHSPKEFLTSLQSPKCSRITWSILGIPISLLNAFLHSSVLIFSMHLKAKKKLTSKGLHKNRPLY